MSEQAAEKERYMVSIYESETTPGALIFTFVSKGLQQERGANGVPKRVPQFVVSVRQEAGGLAFDWSETPDDPATARGEIQTEIAVRMQDRANWIERVTALVGQVEQWAKEIGWSTRRIEKKLDDSWIGKHRVPALLMQEDLCRVLLEPLGRSSLGAEGILDLYLMPAYDDIARLLYHGNQWSLHYLFPGAKPAATVRETDSKPLSKETFTKVLAEMRQHAA